MTRWFRLYDDIIDDPKVQRLPPVLFKAWVNILCVASKHGGELPHIEDLAFALRSDEETVKGWLDELVRRNLIDSGETLRPHNWDKRQFKSDNDSTASERQKRKRDRDKGRDGDRDSDRDITDVSHPPEAEADTEQKQSTAEGGGAALSNEDLAWRLRRAAGWLDCPGLRDVTPIRALLEKGADLELDILPVIEAKADQPNNRETWKYFVEPCREAFEHRKSMGIGSPQTFKTIYRDQNPKAFEAWRNHLTRQGKRTSFMDQLGYYTAPTEYPQENAA